jgi:hypothetical protein
MAQFCQFCAFVHVMFYNARHPKRVNCPPLQVPICESFCERMDTHLICAYLACCAATGVVIT